MLGPARPVKTGHLRRLSSADLLTGRNARNLPKMQVPYWVVTLLCVQLYNRAAALSDEECANYHELRTSSDYATFVEDCAGKAVLGFENGVSNKFFASKLTQDDFNSLFENVVKASFKILIENTNFEQLKLPKLEELNGGLSIRNNKLLRTFQINKAHKFDRTINGPTVVTVDGNPVLGRESMDNLRHLCDYCDIFSWTKCSALDVVKPDSYGDLVNRCAGESIIKQKPGARFFLRANKMTQHQFNSLFYKATHVEMCLDFQDMQWKEITFPNLVRLIPCGYGDPSLRIVHNYYLTAINLPAYDSEGFGRLNPLNNVELKNNFVLPNEVLLSLKSNCRFCKLEQYKECDNLHSASTENATEFVDKCGGKRVMTPKEGHVLILDISTLTQELIDELFMDATHIKMCIILKGSQIRRLRMPHLKKVESCQPGRPAFEIEGNMYLEVIELPPDFDFNVYDYIFHISNNPRLPREILVIFDRCRGCSIETDTRCSMTSGGYKTVYELLQFCPGKRHIVFHDEISVTEYQLQQLCSEAIFLQMCFKIVNTNYRQINCPKLMYMKPCVQGKQVLTIVGNPLLTEVTIPLNVLYPKGEKILIVKKNQKLKQPTIEKLKQICPVCEIEGFFSKCSGMGPITDVNAFLMQCSGQPFIDGAPGVVLEVDLSHTTEEQLNGLFANVEEMQICITIKGSSITRLRFPKLTRWRSCAPGRAALTLINNYYLESLEFPSCKGCVDSAIIRNNPRLPRTVIVLITSWCSQCIVEEYVPSCGLGVGGFSAIDFVRACAGRDFIKPEGGPVYIRSSEVSEALFNAFCSKAVYMEVCIEISESYYRSIRCPHLREVRPCEPGKQVFTIVDNPRLVVVDIPATVLYPRNEKILRVKKNKVLPQENIEKLKRICPACEIEFYFSKCSGLGPITNVDAFVQRCSGQPFIDGAEGVVLEVDLSRQTEGQINGLFANVVEMQICVTIKGSSIRRLVFPKLKQWKACAPGRAALILINNYYLESLEFPSCQERCVDSATIRNNPRLPPTVIELITGWCSRCIVEEYVPSCGLGIGGFSAIDFVRACAGRDFIKPEGGPVYIRSSEVSEALFNAFCSKAVYMEVCIEISESYYRSIRCPHLREVRPCEPGKQVFTIVDNPHLVVVDIPATVLYPRNEKILRVTKNRKLPRENIEKLKKICPACEIEFYTSKCSGLRPITDVDAFIQQCSGQPFIDGAEGVVLEVDLSRQTEEQINGLFANVIEIQICVTIKGSSIKRLVFPKLKQWKACAPGRAALTLIDNYYLESLEFPSCQEGCVDSAIIRNNPRLPRTVIVLITSWCSQCIVEEYVPSCGLGIGGFSAIDFVRACAGRDFIKPEGGPVYIRSSEVSEALFNAFCSKAVYMEVCIEISESYYRSIRCPHLREVRPCEPGKQVFTIVDNPRLVVVDIPATVLYPRNEKILFVKKNKVLPQENIEKLKRICPACEIEFFFSICSGLGPITNVDAFVKRCSGQSYIDGAEGVVLEVDLSRQTEEQINTLFANVVEMQMCVVIDGSNIRKLVFPKLKEWKACAPGNSYIKPEGGPVYIRSSEVSEALFNAFCSKAVYMEVCIEVSESYYRSIRCPHLREIRPCEPGKQVFTIVDNPRLVVVDIPAAVLYPRNEKILFVKKNKVLPQENIEKLKKICPACEIEFYFSKCSGLGPITNVDAFVQRCSGQPFIDGAEGVILEVDLSRQTEEQINGLFANVIEMQICVTIKGSSIKRLVFPKLKQWKACAPGKTALTLTYNFYLEYLEFPSCQQECVSSATIRYNPRLPKKVIEWISRWCSRCVVEEYVPSCGLGIGGFTATDFVRACAGRPYIKPEGVTIWIRSSEVSEEEFNAFCSKAVYMEVCVEISDSNYRSLRCPYLKEIKSCQPGKPVFIIVNNEQLSTVDIPTTIIFPIDTKPFEIYGNPRVPSEWLNEMKRRCPGCRIEGATGCGLTTTEYTDKQLVQACAGKTIIRPAKGFYLTLSSEFATESEMNAICSKAAYMEICIIIRLSSYKALRCPFLKELKPCLKGKPAITIVDNPFFEVLEIPTTTTYPEGETIVEIKGNPLLNPNVRTKLKSWCPHCTILPDYVCGITTPQFTTKEVVAACAGKKFVKPVLRAVVITATDATEDELNNLCSEAEFMEICIEITNSQFRSFQCPKLKELRPCMQGRPAIKIVGNPRLSVLVIPTSTKYPSGVKIVEIVKNPLLDANILRPLAEWCPHCNIKLDYACGITKERFTIKELVAACSNYKVIIPPPGVTLVITSEMVTEEELNRMCANVVRMEVCIEIINSNFKRFRCPNLRELKSCEGGRPALVIKYNPFLEDILIPMETKYPQGAVIVNFARNPSVPPRTVQDLQTWCPHCPITIDYVCGLSNELITVPQVIAACTGQQYIISSPGIVITLKSQFVTENQLNALCSTALVTNICIEIKNSNFKTLRCPKLKEIIPCQANQPAIQIVNNSYFTHLDIPMTARYPTGVKIVEIQMNPMFDPVNLKKIQQWCPGCIVTGDYACGLNKPNPTTEELMRACVGKRIIAPMPGNEFILDSKDFTVEEFNAFCSKVVRMQACIIIEKSNFQRIECPELRELKACRPGKRAFTIVENFKLVSIVFSPLLVIPEGDLVFEIRDNPHLPEELLISLRKLCPGCTISLDTDCGLTQPFTIMDLVAACANKVLIKPSKPLIIEIFSKDVSEAQMNALCAKAAYMEICITISESNYKRFECPVLRELIPCAPGRVAITVIDNPYLTQFFIPVSISYPRGSIILELGGNSMLPWEVVELYRKNCQLACRFPTSDACVLQPRNYLNKELVSTCAGKSKIKPLSGYLLIVSSDEVRESEMNSLCSKAKSMQICITISNSHFKSLRCPYLKELKPCEEGKPAITIVSNLYFSTFEISHNVRFPPGALIFEIIENPSLPADTIRILKSICPRCRITYDYDCGLVRPFTAKQLAAACKQHHIVRPSPGYILEFTSNDLTEMEMNAMCAEAIYLEACIVISASQYSSFRCPKLRELRSCQPGRAAITIINNPRFQVLEIPPSVTFPRGAIILEIYGNPLLPDDILEKYRKLCPHCKFGSEGECVLQPREYTDKELVRTCAGKKIIKPAEGFFLTLSSQFVTEAEMNALCSKATHMQICITIIDSNFKSLRCPYLKELKPCRPGEPAIKIVRNFQFSVLEIPNTLVFPKETIIFEIRENPHLPLQKIKELSLICPLCHITANLACDLEKRHYTDKELIAACAGKTIIRPAEGYMLVLKSKETTEEEFNALCSKAIYMEICIEITNSQFKRLRCPFLRELVPCQKGRPAIKIVGNIQFETLDVREDLKYPANEPILEISEVPHMALAHIKRLQRMCKNCKITANLGCGLNKRTYTDAEMVAACAGKTIVKPAEGYMLVMSSDTVSEAEMNAVCSKAVYMEICIVIRSSSFKSFKCPYLRELKSCKPGVPAIRIVGNPLLTDVSISKTLLYREINNGAQEALSKMHYQEATVMKQKHEEDPL
ncbi:hypothetical protein RB195_009638 [Necator americanus]|uniref:Uncharacterized protein n=1 Tax=Necator americanus TaxID=51031 RepID=A0ABR1CU79_NECAM